MISYHLFVLFFTNQFKAHTPVNHSQSDHRVDIAKTTGFIIPTDMINETRTLGPP